MVKMVLLQQKIRRSSCHVHFAAEDLVRVPGGKRWRLKDRAVPLKAGQSPKPSQKRKPPPVKHEVSLPPKKVKTSILSKSKTDPEHVYQPKSLLSSALAVVSNVYKSMVNENKLMKCKLKEVERELNESRSKLEQKTFGMDIIRSNNELCQHYTGFPDYERLSSCLSFLSVGPNGQNVMMQRSTEAKGSGRPRCLSAEDQFLLLLVKLRNGFSNIHLGWLFNCNSSTISRLFISWVNYVYLKFGMLPIWPTRETINESMPEIFKQKYPNTRVIIDCTEIAVEAPESLHMRSIYYSDYKGRNTYKALTGITPAGELCFVSELFPGSVSDREIVSRCGILNPMFWNQGDEIMADKGFTITDLLDPIGVKLNIPIFLENNAQFLTDQVVINQQIASLRIHVERYISRIKNFHIFDQPLPLTMHGSANQIFTVCAFLVMYQNPIISA